jgi:hypothetical protein
MTFVYSTATRATAREDGSAVSLREGDVWAADDPLVLARPGLFGDEPPAPNFPRRTVRVEALPASPPARRRLRG